MKKKLIQILMLLVVAVSVGSFVSCKDTNEDLYNELRTQYIKDNASLKDAFDAQIAELERQLGQYKTALDAINSCECDEDALKTQSRSMASMVRLQHLPQALTTLPQKTR